VEEKSFRFNVPLAVQKKGYESAFEAYVRMGKANMGPNDLKALSEATEAGGAVLVPEDMQMSILKKTATAVVMRQYARVITTGRDIVKWPRIKYTTDNKYTSAIRLTWTGETPSSTTVHRVTDQVFGEHAIPVNTAMASQLLSADLLEDAAFDVMGISSDLFGEAFGLGEEVVFWAGTGAGQPRGLLTDIGNADFNAAITTGATANTFDADEVIDTAYALPAQYERNARWYMTKATEKFIRKLKNADSDYLWPVIMNVGSLGAVPNDLLEYPRTRIEFMDDISNSTNTTTYPLVLGDLNGYLVVDRVGLSIKRDESLYSELNQVLLLGRKRVGGQLLEGFRFSALKTVNST
jgi:HK97 family phage major capsid protein